MSIRDLFAGEAGGNGRSPSRRQQLNVEELESRAVPAVTASVVGGVLVVNGDASNDDIAIVRDGAALRVLDHGVEVFRAGPPPVQILIFPPPPTPPPPTSIVVNAGAGNDRVFIGPDVTQPATIDGGPGNDLLIAGGGPTTLIGGDGDDKLYGGPSGNVLIGGAGQDLLRGGIAPDIFDGGPARDQLYRVGPGDQVVPDPLDLVLPDVLPPGVVPQFESPRVTITAAEVGALLDRASAATSTNDAIIAIVDRNGRILGVRVEALVAPQLQNTPAGLTFAVDGAVAKARTGAFFASNQAPLTSRTIQNISQTPMTQQEIESIPSITDPNSTLRGPGFVAPVTSGGHFPPNIANTPQVDLFAIEHTNRDSFTHVGPDRIKGTADDIPLAQRFNIDPQFVPPGQQLFAPVSFGEQSGIMPTAQGRGIATLPGGIPIFKNGVLVGGIGVFFPGQSGFATEENSRLSQTSDQNKPDRSLEAEFIAFAAVGGSSAAGITVGDLGGVAKPAGFDLPAGRIDLVGIFLDVFGPGGNEGGIRLRNVGLALGTGPVNGRNVPVLPDGTTLQDGRFAPEGFLVLPHNGNGITKEQVTDIIVRGIDQANRTRAAIRLPFNTTTRMVLAVCDLDGNIVGLYRMPDSTIFSIDVAVAKSRNVNYYANPAKLQPQDRVAGVIPGTAFTNRTFRYLAEPRFPEGIDGEPPGPFSIFNDGGALIPSGRRVGPNMPASAFQSVQGFDAFNPGTNFRDPTNIANQNGIVFFPGSAPIYTATSPTTSVLSGGFGISGDGVDQDDVVTFAGAFDFQPRGKLRADDAFFAGVRLPYQKFNRNPQGGITGENF